MRSAAHNRLQAQNFSRLADLQDQSLAFAVRSHQLHAALAEQVDASGGLPFQEHHRAFRVRADVFDPIESTHRFRRKRTEEVAVLQLAIDTVVYDRQTIW